MPFLSSVEGQYGYGRQAQSGIVTAGLQVNLDAGNSASYSGSGTTWTDLTGNGRNATLQNGPTYSSANNGYLTFVDTSFQHATIPNIGNLPNYTIEAWVRITSALTSRVTAVVCNQFDLVNKLNFSLGTNTAPSSVNICNGFFDGAWRTTSGFAPVVNTWLQIVGTYDGTTLRQYTNAVAGTTLTYTGNPQSGGEVRIMRRWDDSSTLSTNYCPGNLSIVRIYNRALTQAEITQNYTFILPRYTGITPLAGSLLFNGTTAYLVANPGITFGAGAYTFECWFYNTTNWDISSPNIRSLIGGGPNGVVGCISLFFNSSSQITTDKYGGGGQRTYTLGSAITLNAWHHFAFVRNASLVETIFLDGVKATSCAGGTSISGGQQVNSINYDGASKDIAKFYQGQWGGYITNMRAVIGTAVYDPTASSITVPNTGPLAVVNAPNTKYLMLGASVTTDSSGTQTITNPSNLVTQSAQVPF